MKPTPTKVALLVSTAGLGLSWSGAVLASSDSAGVPKLPATFDATPRDERSCDPGNLDGAAGCLPVGGELLQTLIANAAALPLPLAAHVPADTQALQELGKTAAAASELTTAPAQHGMPAPGDDETPLVEAAAALHVTEVIGRTRDAGVTPATPGMSQSKAHTGAETTKSADQATLSDSAGSAESLDRVFASLTEVLGSGLEESPAHPSAAAPAAGPEQDVAPLMPAAVTADAPSRVPPVAAADVVDIGASPQRSAEADDIVVVASHSEKVLMSLAELRSGAEPAAVVGGHTKRTVVVRHADKVLETLALLRSSQSTSDALVCTRSSGQDALQDMGSGFFDEPIAERAMVAVEPLLDIDLDLLRRPTPRPEKIEVGRLEHADLSVERQRNRGALGASVVALSAEKLDEVRGGFTTDNGLKISFGIERAVYLNGNLVTTTSLNIADLSKISGGRAQVTGDGAGVLALVQSGSRNMFAPGTISTTAAGTVIQNTLDHQKINTITRIDAVVNSSSILRSISLESSMRSALIDSLRR